MSDVLELCVNLIRILRSMCQGSWVAEAAHCWVSVVTRLSATSDAFTASLTEERHVRGLGGNVAPWDQWLREVYIGLRNLHKLIMYCHYSHFANEKTESQYGEVSCTNWWKPKVVPWCKSSHSKVEFYLDISFYMWYLTFSILRFIWTFHFLCGILENTKLKC